MKKLSYVYFNCIVWYFCTTKYAMHMTITVITQCRKKGDYIFELPQQVPFGIERGITKEIWSSKKGKLKERMIVCDWDDELMRVREVYIEA